MSQQFPIPRGVRISPDYVATAGQTDFEFLYWLYDAADLEVRIKPVGMLFFGPPLVLNVDYTILNLDQAGGAIVRLFVPRVAGDRVRCIGRRIAARTTSVTQGGTVKSVPLERELDLLNTVAQELRRDVTDVTDRSLLAPEGEAGSILPSVAERAGKIFGWSLTGAPLMYPTSPVPINTPGLESVGRPELKPQAVDYTILDSATVRIPMIGDVTLYVRTDGNDANSGLVNTAGGALRTLQAAWDWAARRDTRRFNVTVRVAAGTYTAGILAEFPLTGGGKFVVINTGAVIIAAPSCFSLWFGARIEVRADGVNLFEGRATASGGKVFEAQWGAGIKVGGGFTYGQGHATAIHNYATRAGSNIEIENSYGISGGGDYHIQASHGGNVRLAGGTINILANITFTGAFLYSLSGADITATGALTVNYGVYTVSAVRFIVHASIIQWIFAFGGRDGPPGNVAGVEHEGGVFMVGPPPYGPSATPPAPTRQGSFVVSMASIIGPVNVLVGGLEWMPSWIEFEIGGIGFVARSSGRWQRQDNSNYSMAGRPKLADATVLGDHIPDAAKSLYFLPTFNTAITGTVTNWTLNSFTVTLVNVGSPTGNVTVWWKAGRY